MMKNDATRSQEWLHEYRAGLCQGADYYARRLTHDPAPLSDHDRQNVVQLLRFFTEFMESMVDFGDDPLERMWQEQRDTSE